MPKVIDLKKLGVKTQEMPHHILPMTAELTDKPFDNPEWLFEIKWDGYRAMAEIKNGQVDLYSRNLSSFVEKYPSVVSELKKISQNVILDGEIIAVDEKGKASFAYLQDYQNNPRYGIIYCLFDILHLDGFNLTKLPLIKRKEILKTILPESNVLKYSDHIEARGKAFFEAARNENLEGIIAKSINSPYLSGQRTKYWLKIKNILEDDFIIVGFTPPQGSRRFFGSLILAAYVDEKLAYVGNVGTGFNEKLLENLFNKFQKIIQEKSSLENPPEIEATWLRPELVSQIRYAEFTRDRLLRSPVFMGLREDKKPGEVNL